MNQQSHTRFVAIDGYGPGEAQLLMHLTEGVPVTEWRIVDAFGDDIIISGKCADHFCFKEK